MLKTSVLMAAVFLFSVFAGCKTTKVYRMAIRTDPVMAERFTPSGDAVTFEKEGVWGAIKPVSFEDFHDLQSLNREWETSNPFEGIYDEYDIPVVFYLKIENRSDLSISFNPTASFSLYFENIPLFPIQYEELYQDLYDTRNGEARLGIIRKILLRSYLTLEPGESVKGLLLFRRPEEKKVKSNEIIFRVRRIYIEKREIDFVIPFRIDMEQIKIPLASKEEGRTLY